MQYDASGNIFTIIVILFIALAVFAGSIRILREYERAVIFTLGRFTGVKGPGLIFIFPFVQTIARVDLRTIVLDVPTQDLISRDNVSIHVNAVIYFRVIDPERAIIQVEQFDYAISQLDTRNNHDFGAVIGRVAGIAARDAIGKVGLANFR
ncbi:SPFH domain-containing protein [Croceicoccus marinus]|uniref:SPFH domain-containing protein n=1 Tax=Croceicoccus marinus TaxID=450378 RepID=UPI000B0E3DD5|nr:SPFH domain-containing protein [Croceicoccus marinus]